MKKNIKVTQEPDNEVTIEVLAEAITSISEGMKKIMNGNMWCEVCDRYKCSPWCSRKVTRNSNGFDNANFKVFNSTRNIGLYFWFRNRFVFGMNIKRE